MSMGIEMHVLHRALSWLLRAQVARALRLGRRGGERKRQG
jgi:hypothetical protein